MAKNTYEFKVDKSVSLIEADLLHFYHQQGGETVSPFIKVVRSQENFVEYKIFENHEDELADSSIVIRSHNNGKKSTITVNLWDSTTWGFTIDDPVKGIINSQFLLAKEKSRICIQFCKLFVEEIQITQSRYVEDQEAIKKSLNALKEAINSNDLSRRQTEIKVEWKESVTNNNERDAKPTDRLFSIQVWSKAKSIYDKSQL